MRRRLAPCVFVLACGDGGKTPSTDAPTDTPTQTIQLAIGNDPDSSYAFQDGDGPWQLAPARSGNTITLTIESTRYAVVRLCGASRPPFVAYAAATETELALPCNVGTSPAGGSITGTITSNPNDAHQLLHNVAFDYLFGSEPSFVYDLATDGTSDFVAVREPASGDAIDVLHVERDLAVSGTVTRDLDFSTLEAPLTVAQPIPDDAGSAYTAFIPSPDIYQFSFDSVAPFVHTVLPVAARRSSDRYDVGVIVDLDVDSTVQFDAILAVPTEVTAPTTNQLDPLDVDPTDGLAITWNKIAAASASGSVSDPEGFAFTSFSNAWQDTFSDRLTFHTPDLAALDGWPARGALRMPADFVGITSVIETGTFPDDGYQATVFQRSSFTPGSSVQPRMRRAIEKARWHDRVRRRSR